MKLRNTIRLIGLLVLGSLTACTDGFEDLNTDPNRPKEITPGVMLGQLQYRIVNSTVSASRNFTHELMQVDAPRASAGGGGLHRYVVNPGAGVWNNFYGYLTDIEDIYKIADRLGENNYKAIALVYKSWAYSILTDLYGDVPYSQAIQAESGVFKPGFDKQKDIYGQVLKDLETANKLFDETKALTYAGDMVFNANAVSGGKNPGVLKWKKFANSLRLRLLLRLSKRDGELPIREQITALLNDPTGQPTMSGTADDAIFRYPGTFPYYNPYYNARQVDWRDGNYFTKFFLDKLNADNDPRRTAWCLPVVVNGINQFVGIESGYPTNLEYAVGRNSSYTDALKTLPQLGVMMPYAEVEFIKAELALKGYPTEKTAHAHYEAGIAASMTQWGVTLPQGFLQQPGIAYNATAPVEKQLEQVMLQKYYAYFFVDYQAWFEKRRTGYPVLPRGAGIPAENAFPVRVPYPTYLQSLNPEGLAAAVKAMGGDDSNIRVWWDR
ncbi:SusD-like starch-binding protein associating with outer membrane [Larkinella arboricola]|uniref:SusD-like starch-binding protein associating with outer membrane n=1 Tax=Larkinella arboricola TaxID=643671 RepID=A0A327WHY7_LARAB|nr:SusD/RagB family nutrient-binding outer membrane lipoprotein [Larkinella arboricola]RAJ90034.1 SusD-like starch-binding protein associating with outer membrane [Larkinella arboricola]